MQNTKKNDFFTESKSFLILYKLTKSLVSVLVIFSALLFCLYLIGNFQNFLDKSLLLILNVLSVSSIICCFLAFCGFLENIFFLFTHESKGKCILSILIMLFCVCLNIFFISYSTVIRELSIGF